MNTVFTVEEHKEKIDSNIVDFIKNPEHKEIFNSLNENYRISDEILFNMLDEDSKKTYIKNRLKKINEYFKLCKKNKTFRMDTFHPLTDFEFKFLSASEKILYLDKIIIMSSYGYELSDYQFGFLEYPLRREYFRNILKYKLNLKSNCQFDWFIKLLNN